MGLLDSFKNLLHTSGGCEQLIRYYDRVFEFKGLSLDTPPLKISFDGVKTEEKIVNSGVSECARSIDDFQYRICKKLSNPIWKISEKKRQLYTEAMFGVEPLILALRNTLEAFKNDPENQKDNLDNIVKKINSFTDSLTEESLAEEKTDRVQNAVLDAFSTTNLGVGEVVRESSQPQVYVIVGNAKFWIPDPPTLFRLYGGWSSVTEVPDGALVNLNSIPVEGTILREEQQTYVWRIEGGQKRHITTPTVLRRYGGWSKVKIVPDSSLAHIPTGLPIT